MSKTNSRDLPFLPTFDISKSVLIRLPEKTAPGYWAGAPSVTELEGDVYLTYRIRRPRGEGRGVINRIAKSSDGVNFRDVFELDKASLGNTPSIERSCLVPSDGGFRFYFSYVNPQTNMWQIDVAIAENVESIDIATRRPVLQASDARSAGVKDPYIIKAGGYYLMYVSFAPLPQHGDKGLHETSDAFATGMTTSNSGLAVSPDGLHFSWIGEVLGLGTGWDSSTTRISSIARTEWGFVAFYDGSAGIDENYEERCGLALTADLRNFQRLSVEGPALIGEGGRSVRYVDMVYQHGGVNYYFETSRIDGSHELRALQVRE